MRGRKKAGRWMVVQCIINGEVFEIGGVYAYTASADRAILWNVVSSYCWRSNAFLCGDFNNAPGIQDNTTGHSHMLGVERHAWDRFLRTCEGLDLWSLSHADDPGYTFQHNACSTYRARLDRWYVFQMHQFDDFVCEMKIDYSLGLSDHAPIALRIQFCSCTGNDPLPAKRLLHVNNAYLKHEVFRNMIVDIISPLICQMNIDMDTAWLHFVMRVQCVIQDYGKHYLSHLRESVQQAKDATQHLMHLANTSSLNEMQLNELLSARTLLRRNNERKLAKWRTRACRQALADKGCASKQFFQHLHHSRQSQAIKRIKLLSGDWTKSRMELAQVMQIHYGRIFQAPSDLSPEGQQARNLFLSKVTPIISMQQAQLLEEAFTETELYTSLCDLGRWKSPGWDGLTVEFFQSFWDYLEQPLLFMINRAWAQQDLPPSWKQGLLKLLPKQALCEEFSQWRPITLMPVVYKLLAKMLANRIKRFLYDGLHPSQYGFIPRRQITDNLANVIIGMEYAKYTRQDVLVMQVDIEKAFDSVLWDYIVDTMHRLGFGPKLSRLVRFLYADSVCAGLLDGFLTVPWILGRSVRQGCPLSALLYAIATHPLLMYLESLTSSGGLHGLRLPSGKQFIAQAYADDTMLMPRNRQNDVEQIMHTLHLFGLAAGLKVNFRKSKLMVLNEYDWHRILWPGEIVPPNVIVRHLGYPVAWTVSPKRKMEWVLQRMHSKLHYWKLSTWPLHVRLRIAQCILIAYVQFFLPLLHWSKTCLNSLQSTIVEHFWRTSYRAKGLRLLSMDKLCSPKRMGGLNILDLRRHVLARKASLLPTLVDQKQPWTLMVSHLCENILTPSFGHWQPTYWEVVCGKLEGHIPGCPFTSSLITDWKIITSSMTWNSSRTSEGNTIRLESLHWSRVFSSTLVDHSARQAYFLFKKGISHIQHVVDDSGHTFPFLVAAERFQLGIHYSSVWRIIQQMIADISPLPTLNVDNRLSDWKLGSSSMKCISARTVYAFLQRDAWIVNHGNRLWSLSKPSKWWKKALTRTWKSRLPLKERLFLWRCLLGILPVGTMLQARQIAHSRCVRCKIKEEDVPHLLWDCSYSRQLVRRVSIALRLRFPTGHFRKYFWLFGILQYAHSQFEVFFDWVRFWVFWTIWHVRNNQLFHRNEVDPFHYFKFSLGQALHFAYDAGDITVDDYRIYFDCF